MAKEMTKKISNSKLLLKIIVTIHIDYLTIATFAAFDIYFYDTYNVIGSRNHKVLV